MLFVSHYFLSSLLNTNIVLADKINKKYTTLKSVIKYVVDKYPSKYVRFAQKLQKKLFFLGNFLSSLVFLNV